MTKSIFQFTHWRMLHTYAMWQAWLPQQLNNSISTLKKRSHIMDCAHQIIAPSWDWTLLGKSGPNPAVYPGNPSVALTLSNCLHRRGREGQGGRGRGWFGVEFCGGGGAVGKAPLPVFSVSGHLLSPLQGQDLKWSPKVSNKSYRWKILPW